MDVCGELAADSDGAAIVGWWWPENSVLTFARGSRSVLSTRRRRPHRSGGAEGSAEGWRAVLAVFREPRLPAEPPVWSPHEGGVGGRDTRMGLGAGRRLPAQGVSPWPLPEEPPVSRRPAGESRGISPCPRPWDQLCHQTFDLFFSPSRF